MDNELEYLVWQAIRNGIQPRYRTIYNYVPNSLYEDLLREFAEQYFPQYRYEFAKTLCLSDTTPRTRFIPWTLKLPPAIIKDCYAIAIGEST